MRTVMRIAINALFLFTAVVAGAQESAPADDRDVMQAIQSLASQYAAALGSCDAEAFAALFQPQSGFFASGFRGKITGHQRLVALVESERHCLAGNSDGSRGRPGGQGILKVSLSPSAKGFTGVIDLGAVGQYQDEYVRTADGWRFAARTVITLAKQAAGLDARQMAAIRDLSADLSAADHYAVGDDGTKRFLSSGVVIRVESGTVGGRVYLDDGGYYDDVYEQASSAVWRIRSRTLVPAATN
jgi:hypothetical protein